MPTLILSNVVLPKDIPWHVRIVHTGAGQQLNVVGDGQADLGGHGGENRAVLGYQLDVPEPVDVGADAVFCGSNPASSRQSFSSVRLARCVNGS